MVTMTFFSLALWGGALGVLAVEIALWRIFRMRMEGLHFPSSLGPVSRIAGLERMRIFVITHTLTLLCVVILSVYFLW